MSFRSETSEMNWQYRDSLYCCEMCPFQAVPKLSPKIILMMYQEMELETTKTFSSKHDPLFSLSHHHQIRFAVQTCGYPLKLLWRDNGYVLAGTPLYTIMVIGHWSLDQHKSWNRIKAITFEVFYMVPGFVQLYTEEWP